MSQLVKLVILPGGASGRPIIFRWLVFSSMVSTSEQTSETFPAQARREIADCNRMNLLNAQMIRPRKLAS